jgi:hypothetical protein
MVPHMRNALKGAYLLLMWKPLVSNVNNILGLLVDEGKLTRWWERLRSGRFLFN